MVKIAAMGDNVVDCYVSRSQMYPGGNCLNVAVHVRRFGGHSAYIGAIGKDPAGDLIHAALSAEQVDISHLRRLDGPTAYCLIGHRGNDRVFLSFDLGVSMFAPSSGDQMFLRDFSAVHVGQSSGLDAYVQKAAAMTRLSYDFSTRRDHEHFGKIGPHCFLASVSAGDLSQAQAAAITTDLLAVGAKWVLLTRGTQGATLAGSEGRFSVPAMPTDAVDTLGAGDTFIARTLFGLLKEEHPQDVLAQAAIAAAATCGHYGAFGYAAKLNIGCRDVGAHSGPESTKR
ncbi:MULTISPECIES: PfkB family carbohydrate kinase [unclassified Mesorhizobium]|uniref:PfkB family carbohydrate kinase n=1 Tax=unclassified Mesorhizobium TaxID=325217 RepID=UPI000BAF0F1D|nr:MULTISPECIES: PfkB family carbohydrate kinase [unclassified Mesorhizobium]TGT57238.1 ribokinase [Mesorhizobium sp. M00.F.Ca.ET.170.01.1.1]AZO12009.1 ribokinase [Mesorhizobium sp. M3A.F.Ca.ET.080.04.2.1]PBB86094.1 ribokinase [Mesorhizobium sp. WSM3876]RWB66703.1 MAG: ribokinase [Mesorhizobium sp.]RWE37961.1 MAG: ribokinase [Mesorhizobium sp.]